MNKKFLSLVLSLVMVLGTFTSVFAASETVKKDEKATEKVEKVEKITGKDNKIQYIIDKKFVEGYGDGEFGYDKNIKRSEITKLLVFANGHKDLSEKLQGTMKLYKDVDTAYWANGVIAVGTTLPSTSNNQAMLNGYPDGNFLPENNVTYAELSKMLVVLVKEDLTADDVKKANANWAGQWMSWAAQLGILDDVTVADSNAAATRADAFTMMYNALYKMQSFKREPANAELGILSKLKNNELELNQDSKKAYKITDNTVFVKNNVNAKGEDNIIKVNSLRNAEYYLGSLVRVMINDKNEVTHILELGNPEEGAIANKKDNEKAVNNLTIVKDNNRWEGVADATVSTDMNKKISSLKDLDEKEIKAYAQIGFDKDDDADTIKFYDSKDNKELELDITNKTEIFVANPANNQMKKVEDIDRALSLIGYKKADKKLPNVYAGYDNDDRKTAKNKEDDYTARVIVFNVVTKNNDKSERYRVINESSSKGVSILEDVDAKKYEENDFESTNRFPHNYGDLNDVIELTWSASEQSYDFETLIDASKTNKDYPIVEVKDVDGNYIKVEDEDENTALLNQKDADVFTKKVKKGDFIQFAVEKDKNGKPLNNNLEVVSIRDVKRAEGFLGEKNIVDFFENGELTGKIKTVEGKLVTIIIDRDQTDLGLGGKTVTFTVAKETGEKLAKFEGYNVNFTAKEYDDKYQAANFEVEVGGKYYPLAEALEKKEDLEKEEAANKLLADAIKEVGAVKLAKEDAVNNEAVKKAVEKQINNDNIIVKAELNDDKDEAKVTLTTVGTKKEETKTIAVSVAK